MIKLKKIKRSSPSNPATLKSNRYYRIGRIAASWVLALLIAFTLQRYAFQSYQVFGQSMQPTLHEGDYLIISKLPVTWSHIKNADYSPRRGDIIVLESPIDGSRLIKRVIGLPDERVTVSNGSIKIYNDERKAGFDPYTELDVPAQYVSGQLTMIVPLDHIFVVGDNRMAGGSLDSRNDLGPIAIDDVVGRLVLRLWPFSQIETF